MIHWETDPGQYTVKALVAFIGIRYNMHPNHIIDFCTACSVSRRAHRFGLLNISSQSRKRIVMSVTVPE